MIANVEARGANIDQFPNKRSRVDHLTSVGLDRRLSNYLIQLTVRLDTSDNFIVNITTTQSY